MELELWENECWKRISTHEYQCVKCGYIKHLSKNGMKNRKSKCPSCNPDKIKAGDVYGELTAIRKVGSNDGEVWEFRCSCGAITTANASNVRKKSEYSRTKTCGNRKIHKPKQKKFNEPVLWKNEYWERISTKEFRCVKCGCIKYLESGYMKNKEIECKACKPKKMIPVRNCESCGTVIAKNRIYCEYCASERAKERRRENRKNYQLVHEKKRFENAKKNGKVDWSINLRKLAERDGYVCAICGELINYDDYHLTDEGYFITHAYYPSIDHIIPLAKGGTHTWDNVQLAHCICNSLKRDKQQYPPFG